MDVENRHTVDRALRIVLGGRVGHVVGADDENDIRIREFVVDVVHVIELIVGHIGFGQEHVHMPRHAASHRVDGVFDIHTLVFQHISKLAYRVLRLRDRQTVAGNDDDILGIGE